MADSRWEELFTGQLNINVQDIEDKVDIVDGNVDTIKVVTDAIPDNGSMTSIAKESTLNVVDGNVDDIKSVVGTKSDYVGVPYVPNIDTLMAYLRTGYYHVHAKQISLPRSVAPITVTAGAGADTEGNKVELSAAGAFSTPLDIHWLVVSNISAADDYMLTIYTGGIGSEEFWGECSISRDNVAAASNNSQDKRIQGPQIPAGTRISVSLKSGNGSNSLSVKAECHGYPTDV